MADGFICARRFRGVQERCAHWKWIYAKEAEDWRFRGNQSLAHGDVLFERYVCESARAALFFAHLREALILLGHLNYTWLASKLLPDQIKLWNIFDFFPTGSNGKGACKLTPHTLWKLAHSVISLFKNVPIVNTCLVRFNNILLI